MIESNSVPSGPSDNDDRMPPAVKHSSGRAFWKILISLDRSKMAPFMALRNSVGMLLSFALGVAAQLGFGAAAAGCGALFVSYSDGSDPYRHRALRLIAASLVISCAAFVGGMSERYPFGVGVVAAIAAFIAGMAVAFGQTAADMGMVSVVMLILFAGQQLTLDSLVGSALLALTGGLVQTALSLALWPVRKYEPERRALAMLYLELGRIAREPIGPADAPPGTVRISQTHAALRSLQQEGGAESIRVQSLLNQAERARLCVIELLRAQTALNSEARSSEAGESLTRFLGAAGAALAAIGEFLLGGTQKEALHDQIAKVDELIEALRAHAVREAPSEVAVSLPAILFQMDALAGQLRAAEGLATGSAPTERTSVGRARAHDRWRSSLNSVVTNLRANLNFRSTVFRHAVRLSICLTIAGVVARATGWNHGYWIPMTVVLVLRPDFAGTFSRGLLRIIGTITGLIVATAAFHWLPHTMAAQATAIGICVFLLRWLGPANYGLFAMGVTAMIVLMLALTGAAPKELIVHRLVDTSIGGMLALSAYAIWPTREPVEDAMAKLLAAYRHYFGAVAQAYLPTQPPGTSAEGERLAARLARTNLEASIDRLAAEPLTDVKQIESVRAMMASSHRFAHATMSLEAAEKQSPAPPASQNLERFITDVEATLSGLERVLHGQAMTPIEMPDLRADFRGLRAGGAEQAESSTMDAVPADAIVNSVNTLREQILQWQESQQKSS